MKNLLTSTLYQQVKIWAEKEKDMTSSKNQVLCEKKTDLFLEIRKREIGKTIC